MSKEYVGNGWSHTFSNGGTVINISIKKSKVLSLEENQYGDIKLVVGERRGPDSKSKATHYVAVDDYAPKQRPSEDKEDFPF